MSIKLIFDSYKMDKYERINYFITDVLEYDTLYTAFHHYSIQLDRHYTKKSCDGLPYPAHKSRTLTVIFLISIIYFFYFSTLTLTIYYLLIGELNSPYLFTLNYKSSIFFFTINIRLKEIKWTIRAMFNFAYNFKLVRIILALEKRCRNTH